MVFKCAWTGPSISKFVKSERILQKHTLCGTICFADSLYFLVIGICTVYLFCLKHPMNYWYMYGISVLPETSNELLVYVRYICFTWNLQWTIGICAVYLFYLEHTMNLPVLPGKYNEVECTYLFYLEHTLNLSVLPGTYNELSVPFNFYSIPPLEARLDNVLVLWSCFCFFVQLYKF